MKSFIAFAALIAVAVAGPLARDNKPAANANAELAAIIAAIESPNTDPATAALLEAQLASIIGSPVSVGPAIVDVSPVAPSPIAVGPAIIDFPLPDGGVVTAVEPAVVNPTPVVAPSPVVIGEIPAGQTPLVQIIVNVQSPEAAPVAVPTPVGNEVVEEVFVPGPVNVVDNVVPAPAVISPVQVAEPVVISPVQVAEPVIPGPVNVVDNVVPVVISPVQVAEPVVVSPVQVATPVIVDPVQVVEPQVPIVPSPVVVLPEELN